MRHGAAVLLAIGALAIGAPVVSAQSSEDASCVAHFVHGPAGAPGPFRAQFGGDIDAVPMHPFGARISLVAHAEGTDVLACLADVSGQ